MITKIITVIAFAFICFATAYYLTDYPSIHVVYGTEGNHISPRRQLKVLSVISKNGYSAARPIYEMEKASFLRRQVASGCLVVAGVIILVVGLKGARAKGVKAEIC